MQAAGNATTGGDVWWQNPAVGRLRISGAAVDLESLTLATPFFLPTACLDGADLMAIAAELSGECRAERRVDVRVRRRAVESGDIMREANPYKNQLN